MVEDFAVWRREGGVAAEDHVRPAVLRHEATREDVSVRVVSCVCHEAREGRGGVVGVPEEV